MSKEPYEIRDGYVLHPKPIWETEDGIMAGCSVCGKGHVVTLVIRGPYSHEYLYLCDEHREEIAHVLLSERPRGQRSKETRMSV